MSEQVEVLRVEERIEIEADPDRVFRALTDPSELPLWWGDGENYQVTTAQVDLRPGGAYRLAGWSARSETFHVTGTYREVDPPRRLAYSWTPSWSEVASTSEVEITLEPVAGGTRVHVVHTGFASPEAREEYAGGWPTVLGWLAEHVARA